MSVDALRRARARSSKVTFVLTSDAHHADELERVRYAALNAERAWIEPDRVVNARTAEELLAWTAAKVPA
jgi:histidinol phosphatase-like PHP family hydrolase